MKSKIASLCLLFAAACNNTVSFEGTETEEGCAAKCREIECPDAEDSGSAECPPPGSTGDCALTYPECEFDPPEGSLPGDDGAQDGKVPPMTRGIIVYTARDGGSPDPSDTTSGNWQ